MEEVETPSKFVLPWHISAPSLESLNISFAEDSDDYEGWSEGLRFKALKEVQIETGPFHPALDILLVDCSSVTQLYILTREAQRGVREFVDVLAKSPHILPNLEHLQVSGASIVSLKQAVLGRLHLKSLFIHILDLGLTVLSTEVEFEEWCEARAFLEGSVSIDYDYETGIWGGMDFYSDGMDRYRTWDDMKRGHRIEPVDWAEIEQVDRSYWLQVCRENFARLLTDIPSVRATLSGNRDLQYMDSLQAVVQYYNGLIQDE